ncbi:MAG: DNA/RNA non-specific endonuclease [Acidobacteriota bacterium]
MKKFFVVISASLLIAFCIIPTQKADADLLVSPHLVVSQFQTGGGGSGTFNDEFVEIHNNGTSPIDLSQYSLVYRSASGSNDVLFMTWPGSTFVPAGGYYLIASSSYDGAVTPDATYNPTSCQCSMGAAGGGLAIRSGQPNTGAIIDSVGWGTANNIFVEGSVTAAPAANNSQSRAGNGCTDTDNNSTDFAPAIPAAPRSSASPGNLCGGGGTTLFAAMNAYPSTVSPGGNTILTVTVIPATIPPSTGISVVGNLTSIGGSAAQTFFDNGTNGDVTAGDNVFSYLAVIPAETTGGIKNLTAAASDAQARTVNLNVNITVNAPLPGENPLIFGNPSGATADIANENNYLMLKPQYTLSYNRSRATANWVAWRLDSSWVGSADRQNDFRPDTSLPNGWYQVLDEDYSGSGYDRGHMCPSGDRTNSVPNNSATFLMTNMVPQLAANNQGPWEEFESYCRTLASQGNEIYIYSGVMGNIGTIAGGKIVVPAATWKVVLVLPNGSNDLERVNRSTRVFGIVVPNAPPLNINAPWRQFRVHVDAVEYMTGYDFFTNVPKNTQEIIERRRDQE